MTSSRRGICWLALLVVVGLVSTVALRAAYSGGTGGADARWASPEALGDVVISFDGVVRFYDNAGNSRGDISVSGSNRGLAFDGALNLFVANTNGTVSSIQKLPEQTPQTPALPIPTQANPQSIVFAGNGDYFVASRVSATQALIRRFGAVSTDYTVIVDATGTCIGVDLDADQKTLNIVDGATGSGVSRVIRRLDVSAGTALPSITLPSDNKAAACAIRTLPPARGSNLPTGGYLVADKDNIKRVGAAGGQVGQAFVAGLSSPTDDNWTDVELDPNTFDFWGLNAGEFLAARFKLASPPSGVQSISVSAFGVPRGLTVNGSLRAAQTIRLLNVTPNTRSTTTPSFYAGTDYAHAWQIKPETTNTNATAYLAVQAVDATSNGASLPQDFPSGPESICPVSLDVDCRINAFFSPATAIGYSRRRALFYMVTELQPQFLADAQPPVPLLISLYWSAADTTPGPGAPCVPGGTTQPAVAVLRDPYPHTATLAPFPPGYSAFIEDNTILFSSGDGTGSHEDAQSLHRGPPREHALLGEPGEADEHRSEYRHIPCRSRWRYEIKPMGARQSPLGWTTFWHSPSWISTPGRSLRTAKGWAMV